ncbi:MAG: hypothetical protein QHJ73_16830, partial [Armatimonadota bacterium]|nr:hypothetical protein [Armatimonadota bacterium]
GEEWRRALGPVANTSEIKVLAAEEGQRLAAMEREAPLILKRLGYARCAAGNVAVLDDALPGFDRQAPRMLAEALRRRGLGVTLLDADSLANPWVLDRRCFDLVLLTDSRAFPATACDSLLAFLSAGGHLAALNGPAFQRPLWKLGGAWRDQEGVLEELAGTPERRLLFRFDAEETTGWVRATNDPSAPSRFTCEKPGAAGSRRAARLFIANLSGWDTFASPPLSSPFPPGHVLTCFAARGDARTSELSVEWRERDGSRWIAVVPLETRWRRYALPPEAFRYWHDNPSQGRGGSGDTFRPQNAETLVFGLAATHTSSVGGGPHEVWIDEVATAPLPAEMRHLNEVFGGVERVPVLEGISPGYKLYPVSGFQSIQVNSDQVLWRPARLPRPAATLSPHARPQGTGFGKERRWRWVPLLTVRNRDGKTGGAAATLLLHGKPPYEGGVWLTMPVTDAAFFRRRETVAALADVVARMLDGVFLYEGGARKYACFDGESVELGAEAVNFGRQHAEVTVQLKVFAPRSDVPLFAHNRHLSLPPGARRAVHTEWHPGRFAAEEYTVVVELLRGGKVIDFLRHPLTVWRPSPNPAF